MAHVILVLSGLADDPQEVLDGKTPLEAAATPNLDRLSVMSELGTLLPLPDREADDPDVGCDQTTLACFGYDEPVTGRGALELLGAGAEVRRRDVGVRLDLIRTEGGLEPFPQPPTATEAAALWDDLERVLTRGPLTVRRVDPGKALGLWEEGPLEGLALPPGRLDPARSLDEQLPEGDLEVARKLIDDAREVLADHPVNRRRRDREEPTFDALWPWGFGRVPDLPMFVLRTGQIVSVLTRNLAVRGVARAAGVSVSRRVPEAELPPSGRAARILSVLEQAPTVYVHVSDLDRLGHAGDPEAKRDGIQRLDRELFGPLAAHLTADRTVALTVLVDYACRCETRRHAVRPVPYLAYRPGAGVAGPEHWCEPEALDSGRQRTGPADLRGWLWTG